MEDDNKCADLFGELEELYALSAKPIIDEMSGEEKTLKTLEDPKWMYKLGKKMWNDKMSKRWDELHGDIEEEMAEAMKDYGTKGE